MELENLALRIGCTFFVGSGPGRLHLFTLDHLLWVLLYRFGRAAWS